MRMLSNPWLFYYRRDRRENRAVQATISECCDAQVWWHWRDSFVIIRLIRQQSRGCTRWQRGLHWPGSSWATQSQPSTLGISTLREINPLNAELNPICHLLALLGAHPILHISRIRVKTLTALYIKITLFWDVTPCSLGNGSAASICKWKKHVTLIGHYVSTKLHDVTWL